MVLRCLLREAVGAGCAPTGVVRGGGGAMGALSWAANPFRVLVACNPQDGGDSPWSRAVFFGGERRMVLRCLLRVAAGAGCALTGVVRGGGSAMGAISWAANSSRVLAACNPRAEGTLLGRVL
jgi:hypothetical protein